MEKGKVNGSSPLVGYFLRSSTDAADIPCHRLNTFPLSSKYNAPNSSQFPRFAFFLPLKQLFGLLIPS